LQIIHSFFYFLFCFSIFLSFISLVVNTANIPAIDTQPINIKICAKLNTGNLPIFINSTTNPLKILSIVLLTPPDIISIKNAFIFLSTN